MTNSMPEGNILDQVAAAIPQKDQKVLIDIANQWMVQIKKVHYLAEPLAIVAACLDNPSDALTAFRQAKRFVSHAGFLDRKISSGIAKCLGGVDAATAAEMYRRSEAVDSLAPSDAKVPTREEVRVFVRQMRVHNL